MLQWSNEMPRKAGLILIILVFFCGSLSQADPQPLPAAHSVTVHWKGGTAQKLLKSWSLDGLRSLKRTRLTDREPSSAVSRRFEGVSFSELIDQAIDGLPPEEKAVVDLVIVRNAAGDQALIPRSFVQRYRAVLALQMDGKALGARAPYSVMPWTSDSKASREGLPLEHYFVEAVSQIELTNYRQHFEGVFLQRRTNPLAVRGEKIFVRTCLACHEANRGPSVKVLQARLPTGEFKSFHSKEVIGLPSLSDLDQRGLQSYFRYIQRENPAFMQKVTRAE